MSFTVQPVYTIACWVFFNGAGPSTFLSTPNLSYGIDGIQYVMSHNSVSTAIGGVLPLYTWQHIVTVYNSVVGTLLFYLNGTLLATLIPEPYTAASGPLSVGDGWTGSVDDIRVYDGILTASQILSLYIFETTLTDASLVSIPFTSPDFTINFGGSDIPTETDTGGYGISFTAGTAQMFATSRPNTVYPPKSINAATIASPFTSIISGQPYGNGNYIMSASSTLDVFNNFTLPFQYPFSESEKWITAAGKYDTITTPGAYLGAESTTMAYRIDYAYTGLMRTFLLPPGVWTFTLTAGQGGDSSAVISTRGGYGMTLGGTVTFTQETLLGYAIGGKGVPGGTYGGGGGGGGTYVFNITDNYWLFVAGGGGGAGPPGTRGGDSVLDSGTGTGGPAGETGAGGGGGITGVGAGGIAGGRPYTSNCIGGSSTSPGASDQASGGFGGGGANYVDFPSVSGGGGGGYSGGAGGAIGEGGAGGSSYFTSNAVNTFNSFNTAGGNGSIIVSSPPQAFKGEWIQLQVPQPFLPQVFYAYEIGGKNATVYKIAGSKDGSNWTLLFSGTGQDAIFDAQITKLFPGVSQTYTYFRYIASNVNTTTDGTFALGGLSINTPAKGYYVGQYVTPGGLTINGYTPSSKDYSLSTWTSYILGTSLFQQGTDDLVVGISSNAFTLTHNGVTAPFSGLDPGWSNRSNTFATPFTSTVSLLMHCEDFTDSSTYGSTISTAGNVDISTVQAKFGGSSISFPDETNVSSIVAVVPTSNVFGFMFSPFTIEFWMYPLASPLLNRRIMGNADTTEFDLYKWIMTFSQGKIGFSGTQLGSNLLSANTVTNGTWTHVAVTRQENTFRLFLNGILESTTTITRPIDNGGNQPLYIGRASPSDTGFDGFFGFIDEIRISKGYAQYTQNFIAPTEPFTLTSVLTKLPGTLSGWNGLASTNRNYVYSALISAKAVQTTANVMFGFSESQVAAVPSTTYSSQNFAWYCRDDATLEIFELGVSKGTFGAYTTNTILSITFENGTITYYKNGIVQRSVLRTAAVALYGMFSPYSSGGITEVTFDNYARLSDYQWQHITVTYTSDLNVATLYIDGKPHSTTQVPLYVPSDESLVVGQDYIGLMDDVRVYGGALSATEVQSLYNYEANLPGEALIIANPGYVQIASLAVPTE
jgi:hypothetical protein